MAIQIGGNNVIDNNRKGIFQSANVGAFANPARPGSASTGDLIYSTTDGELQVWDGSAWVSAGGGFTIAATGGDTITTSPDGFYKTHIFESSGTFTLPTPAILECHVVAGGGACGVYRSNPLRVYGGGGGGAGGHLYYSGQWDAGSYTVTIGAGAATIATNGSPSSFQCPTSILAPGAITCTGGGAGGDGVLYVPSQPIPSSNGSPGGSGGGGGGGNFPPAQGGQPSGGTGIPGQGNNGARGTRGPTNSRYGGGGGSVVDTGEVGDSVNALVYNGTQTYIFYSSNTKIEVAGGFSATGGGSIYGAGGQSNRPSPYPTAAFGNSGVVLINYAINQS